MRGLNLTTSSTNAAQALTTAFIAACTSRNGPHAGLVHRYLSTSRLRALVKAIGAHLVKEEKAAKSALPPQSGVVELLLEQGLVKAIGTPAEKADPVYWLRPCGGIDGEHDPIEVLTGLHEQAIVAHMSALQFHGLLEEVRPDAHYLTYPVNPKPRERQAAPATPVAAPSSSKPRPRTGTHVLTLRSLPFRMRSMKQELIFGVVRRWTPGQVEFSVFDRERSLLFCLSEPSCNGGLRGLMEAWQRGAEELREGKVLEYLRQLDSAATWRRAGLLAERLGLEELRQGCLDVVQQLAINEEHELHLVSHLDRGTMVHPWRVIAPW